jgi:methyl-accepting chemotaxis protein
MDITTALIADGDNVSASSLAEASNTTSSTVWLLLAVAFMAAVLSVATGLYVASLISKPLAPLTSFMKQAGTTGNISLRPEDVKLIEKYSAVKDEIGQTIDAAAAFVVRVGKVSQVLETVADGDLTSELDPLSDKDVLGLSLQKMTGHLNEMFCNINASSSQVSAGASQVADGAQALAQGATEQAATIQQLSSAIAEITEKTKANANEAGQASKLADTIKNSAEKGSRQMEEMIGAVKDISQASQDIGQVIKTIDNIAFQTNILALNASVEAARAGQHGKGFAVVAEEVRNLAAKSAEAAKDTETLIANSMEKADLGVRIAGETSSSLSEIVTGINESSDLVSNIATSSEEQSQAISQINSGIEQLAQVVQQNSATAEESAATSEEMSGQSQMLREQIAQFKIKGNIYEAGMITGSGFAGRYNGSAEHSGFALTNSHSGMDKYSSTAV